MHGWLQPRLWLETWHPEPGPTPTLVLTPTLAPQVLDFFSHPS